MEKRAIRHVATPDFATFIHRDRIEEFGDYEEVQRTVCQEVGLVYDSSRLEALTSAADLMQEWDFFLH